MSAKAALVALLLLSGLSLRSVSQESSHNQDQVTQHARLAQRYLQERKPELAIPELEKVIDLDPGNLDARANLGVLLFFRGEYASAVSQLHAALKIQPNLWKIRALLGLAEVHTSDAADALNDLEAAFPLIQDKKLKVEVGLELVGLYNQSSDLDDAAGIITQLRKADPENAEVQYAAYRTYADLSGESMLELSLAAPDSAQMHQLLAHEETREGNTNAAIAQYRKAIAIDAHLPGVHYELAEILHTSEDPVVKKEAEQEYRAAVAESPQDEKAICKLGEIAAAKGDLKQTYDDYAKAAALQPADAEAKLGLAKALIEMNEPDKALLLLEASAQLEPTSSAVHYRLATLYKKMRRPQDAEREVALYKKYKEMKENLHAVYKDLAIQPQEIREDGHDEK
jgi:tetratricopeptide (TPR) repeat protein